MSLAPATAVAVLIGLGALAFLVAVAFARIPEVRDRHWFLLFAVLIFPGLALLLGAERTLEAAKRPEFCGSCHVMDPWVRDLHDPDSKTLAAVHFQNRFILEDQCYTCHTDYGLTGPLRAKLTGVVHFLRNETGTYRLPIELYAPYDFANCLRCHGESKRYLDAHVDALEAIADGSMSCTDCHGRRPPAAGGRVKVEGPLRIAVLAMAAALVLMLVTLVWPTPHTIGLFLGPGLGLGALSLGAFGLRVYRDLRARGLL